MDHRSNVTSPTTSERIQADYAIFTSIRSPMGNGYQIVAASKGISPAEKSEIQRRSPSHNALCSTDTRAVGLATYPLASGRYVVAMSRYGNKEYSGRGGRCIDTHIVILDDEAYAAFDCNPLRVQQALVEAIGQEPVTKPSRQVPPVMLEPASSRAGDAVTLPPLFGTPDDGQRITYLARCLLARRPIVVMGAEAPFSALEWTLMTLPAGWRRNLSLSAGIKFSIARQHDCVLLEDEPEEISRVISGHGISAFRVIDEPQVVPDDADEWFHFVERCWRRNRFNEISRLTASYASPGVGIADLSRVVSMCGDRDLARFANAHTRSRLHQNYTNWTARHSAEVGLAREIAELTRPEPEAPASPKDAPERPVQVSPLNR